MRKSIAGCVFVAFLLIHCISAYAFNDEYFNESVWLEGSDIYSQTLDVKKNDNSLEGVFKYRFDSQNNVFYTYLSVCESSISDENDDIRIVYKVENVFEAYNFAVNKDGICDAVDSINNCFSAESRFETYRKSNCGLYISALQINDDCLLNSITIKLYVNGNIYKIIDNITLQVQTEKEFKAIEGSSQASTVEDAPYTTKKVSTTRTPSSTRKITEKSTKYKYTASSKYHADSENTTVITASAQEITTSVPVQKNEINNRVQSPTTKAFCGAGIGVAIIGTALIIISVATKAKQKENA